MLLRRTNHEIRDVRARVMYGETKNAYNISVRKSEGKKPLRRPKRIRKEDIKVGRTVQSGRLWTAFVCLGMGTVGRLL